MNTRMQMWCLWCGPAAMILFFLGFWGIAGLVPPPSPDDSALEIQQMYVDDTDAIRIGLVITMIAGALTGPFAAAICTQMKRIEGTYSPLSYTELGMGMLGVLLFIFPTLVMQVCAFRPAETDPDLLLSLNDLAWIPFVGIFAPAVIQNIAIGIAAFKDAEGRVFPRWLGYFNFWAALAFLPAALLYFFKTGPFAWDGVFVFWVPLTIFGAWFFVMFFVTRKAIKNQELEEAEARSRRPRPSPRRFRHRLRGGMTSTRIQLLCVWAGPAFLVLYAIFFWGIAGFIPPTDPIDSANEIASFYDDNRTDIRIGQLGGMIASALLFPFFAVISIQIARIERGTPILAMIQFGAAVLLLVFFAICSMLWVAATFRQELGADTVRALHDLSWLMFVMVFPGYTLQMLCMAIAGFMDKSPTPTWPRWAAYFNLWVAFSGMGGGLAVFFKEGPFAWNGLIGFYVPIAVFAAWLVMTTVLLLRAIKRQAAEEEQQGPTAPVVERQPVGAHA